MRLVKLQLTNFRCYRDTCIFNIDDLTALIGKNDAGKSSVLEALDGFFNNSVEYGDLSSNADVQEIEICCWFDEVPENVVLDTSVESSPAEEGILNCDGLLEVKKVFSFGAAGRKTAAIFLKCFHPSDPRLATLLSMKNGPLKSLAGDLGADLAQVNRSKNPPIREVIRGFIGGERQEIELKVDGGLGTEDNLKAIWSSIRKLLPIYTLFKTDKSFDDKDSDVKSPLQAAIDEALGLPEIQALLEEVESKVKEYSTNVAEKTIEKLKNFDASLSESMKSEFGKSPSYGKVFDLTLLNAENIPLNKRGSGIRRLVVLSFFQAQAEKRKMDEGAPAIIYGIEEPETSQHPNHQKMIISSLSDLSAQENVQVLFTTHSANLVKEIPIASLRYISATPDSQILVEYGDKQDDGTHDDAVIDKIVNALGILPNPAEKISVLVYVEGNNDVSALKRYSKILHEDDAAVLDIGSSESVGYVITGGSALKHYIEQKHLHGLGKPEVHIYDNDVADYRRYVDVINTAGNPNRVGFNTTKTELENYLHSDAISEAYASSGQDGIEFDIIDDDIDVPLMVAQRVYQAAGGSWNDLPEDKQKKKSDEKKKLLNTAAVEAMTVERLRDRNGYDDIRSWLEKIAHFV